MMKPLPWALVLALVLAYAGLGIEIAYPFLVIACALAFYHHSPRAGAASVASMVILAGVLYASGMRQYAFGVSEASLGMLMAATFIAAWKWRVQAEGEREGGTGGRDGANEGTAPKTKRKRIGAHAGGRAV